MKVLFAILCVGLAAFAFDASAQVTVELTLDQQQFLPGEDLPVTVHVTNRSGEQLHLGDAGWLTFFIQFDDGSMVIQKSDPPVKGAFDLGNSEVALKRVNLAPCFNLERTGTYHVTATLHIAAWNTDISSPPLSFDVIQGAQLWSQSFGVANPRMPNRPPRVYKYALVEANYLQQQLRLYVEVTDDTDGTILGVRALGPMISFSQPEAQLDSASKLHVLWQSGATTFTHSVVGTDGKIIRQEIYDYINTRPRLSEDDKGDIIVRGGARRMQLDTIPPVRAPDEVGR